MIKRIIEEKSLKRFIEIIDSVSRIVITCHKKADGDAIGSSLALCQVLRNMGKNATVIIPDQLPASLTFITQGIDFVVFSYNEIRASDIIRNTQLIFSLDYNDFDRVAGMKQMLVESKAKKILIDHHLNPSQGFDVQFSYPELSSTCELLYRLLDESGLTHYLDCKSASCIFVGIMTDTGNLAFSSSYPEVYQVMAKLIEYGIDKPYLYKKAMDTMPLNSLLLQSYALLHKMTIIDGDIALITLDKNDLEQYNYKTGDTERLVNRPLSIEQVYWSTFMREDSSYIKVSMRSEGNFAVDEICSRYFNGGGHMHAAAGEFYGTMEEAIELFYKIINGIRDRRHERGSSS